MSDDGGIEEAAEHQASQSRIVTYSCIFAFVAFLAGGAYFLYATAQKHEHTSTGSYVGSLTCRKCHLRQYESWAKSRMAQTFEVLRPGVKVKEKALVGLAPDGDFTHEKSCLPCHTTGYGRVGGFVSIEETPEMAGVGCEACHGAGGMYVETVMRGENREFAATSAVEAGLVYPPTEKVCQVCHNERSPFIGMAYKFDFDERVKRGTHEHFPLKYEHEARP